MDDGVVDGFWRSDVWCVGWLLDCVGVCCWVVYFFCEDCVVGWVWFGCDFCEGWGSVSRESGLWSWGGEIMGGCWEVGWSGLCGSWGGNVVVSWGDCDVWFGCWVGLVEGIWYVC